MIFAQWWNQLITNFSECIPMVKWHMIVFSLCVCTLVYIWFILSHYKIGQTLFLGNMYFTEKDGRILFLLKKKASLSSEWWSCGGMSTLWCKEKKDGIGLWLKGPTGPEENCQEPGSGLQNHIVGSHEKGDHRSRWTNYHIPII